MDSLREHMSKIQDKFIMLLERELKRIEQSQDNNPSEQENTEIDSKVYKIKSRLEAERKIHHMLFQEGTITLSISRLGGRSSGYLENVDEELTNPELKVGRLLEDLDVANDVSELKTAFEQIKTQIFSSDHDYYAQILSLKQNLQQISERIESARNK